MSFNSQRLSEKINPIWWRETRNFGRSPALWLVPLGLIAMLGAMMIQRAASWADEVVMTPQGPSVLGLWGLGFCGLFWLLAPALAAPSIAWERETGLLEGLQLSRLRPAQIVLGKWFSALLRLGWLWLVALPVQSTSLWFGGLTMRDVLAVWLVSGLAGATACAFGVFCSAWSHRAPGAMRMAYGFLFIGHALTLNLFSIAAWGRLFPIPIRVTHPQWLQIVDAIVGILNPFVAYGIAWWPPFAKWVGRSNVSWISDWPIFALNLTLQVLAAAFLLWASVSAVEKPFASAQWMESSHSPLRDWWQNLRRKRRPISSANIENSDDNQVVTNAETVAVGSKVKRENVGDGWWELPVASWIRFANPLAQREFVGKFRMREVPRVVILTEAVLGVGVLLFYVRALWLAVYEAGSRGLIWWALSFIGLLVVMSSMLVMGASSLSREMETGTWTALRLSHLNAREILSGKLSAMLAACLVFSLPFWPLMALCVRGWNLGRNGLGVNEALATLMVLASTALGYGMVGISLSWLFRRTTGATLCGLLLLVVCDVMIPILSGVLQEPRLGEIDRWFNPAWTMLRMMTSNSQEIWREAVPVSGVLTSIALLLAIWMLWQLQHAQRERK